MEYGPQSAGRFFRVRIPLSRCVMISLMQYSVESRYELMGEDLDSEMLCDKLSEEFEVEL